MLLHERALGKYAARETHVKHVDRIKRIREIANKFLRIRLAGIPGRCPAIAITPKGCR